MTDIPPWLLKRPAADKAVDDYLEDGMIVGLGTGNAANMAVAFGGTALVAMLIAPANGLGCICVGTAMDKIGMKWIMVIGQDDSHPL